MFRLLTHPLLGIIAGAFCGGFATVYLRGPDGLAILCMWLLTGTFAICGSIAEALASEIFPIGVNMILRQTVIFCACFIAGSMLMS